MFKKYHDTYSARPMINPTDGKHMRATRTLTCAGSQTYLTGILVKNWIENMTAIRACCIRGNSLVIYYAERARDILHPSYHVLTSGVNGEIL